MNYTKTDDNNQSISQKDTSFLMIPNSLERFLNKKTSIEKDNSGRDVYVFYGEVLLSDDDLTCEDCGSKMHVHNTFTIILKHVPIGGMYSIVKIERKQLKCSKCSKLKMQEILFKDDNHMITKQLHTMAEDLLSKTTATNKMVSCFTGINKNIVKEIDKARLMIKYTVNGKGEELIPLTEYSKYLGIDEFKLHNGYIYATHIIDYETGHILWIMQGKKKNVVYAFMKYVGDDWMKHVVAVACDMNSDFEEAFKDKYPHIAIVYDHFHIVKNFNEKVIAEIRKEEQKRLEDAGDKAGAKALKRSRFLLTSNTETLEKKDREAAEGKVISNGSALFKKDEVKRTGGHLSKYNEIVNKNELFIIIELIKELLSLAYNKNNTKEEMADYIFQIMELCEENGNTHLLWFKKLLYEHFDGIINYAIYNISSGEIEGINNKVKTLRRQAYGYPDDDYFFLKLLDMSRH